MTLNDLFSAELPLNRKEKFFTGTVFPMIVCKNNFQYFNKLLQLIKINNPPEVLYSPLNCNIQFFSEYSFIESLPNDRKKEFPNLPESKDTPDIVILIQSIDKYLISFEAKMYHKPNVERLNKQMSDQRKILNCIASALNIRQEHIIHYALLPQNLNENLHNFNFPVITWEQLCFTYNDVCKEDYFFNILLLALESYNELASPSIQSFGKYCEEIMTGKQIYELYKMKNFNKISMGRNGGLSGKLLKDDIAMKTWQDQKYETSSREPPNTNWFPIDKFIILIETSY